MSTDVETYSQDLLLALRLRDVPGPRIADALAEVDSHVAESGEDPRDAFGPPKDYARQLADILGARSPGGWRGWRAHLSWSTAAIAVASLLGGWLVADGVIALGAGAVGPLGLPAAAAVPLGVALCAAVLVRLVVLTRRDGDPVLDPRTGADMAGPVPRWAVAVLVAFPVGLLVLSYVLGTKA